MNDLKKESVSKIKEYLEQKGAHLEPTFLEQLKLDSRVSVQKLAQKWEREQVDLQREKKRLEHLQRFEKELRQKKFKRIAGVDEAGRGPLAGPVCVACCILPEKWDLPGLDDSKKISEKKRAELAEAIKKQAIAYKILLTPSEEIDRLNILQATLKTAYRALQQLDPQPDYVLTDALKLNLLQIPYRAIEHGDALSCSIAAASILAKTARDQLMMKLDEEFPQYGFKSHKGYGAQSHCEAILEYGPSTLHRLSFGKVVVKAGEPLVHSKSFEQFRQAMQNATSLAQLEAIAPLIQQKKNLLPAKELDDLRKNYLKEKERLSS